MEGNEPMQMGYEEAMKELEALVKRLEKGDLDLEASLALYERAVALKRRCQAILDESERRVEAIFEEEGQIIVKDFD
ncbi:MAG TPA: exodeoxyribonuclease VII small subunit [Methanomassiliicoccales archaeon]|jgi:exodeoxyribonuclease VII small subunit|nr:exodeoxyribonuclease VII small subunit [Methanomassiliicoccales archaeon]